MGRKNIDTSQYLDALRLPAEEVSAILNELEAIQNGSVAAELRNSERTSIQHTAGFIVRMFQPGGTVVNYLVKLRNISRTGVAFLHGSFVYERTACTFLLKARSGQVREIAGRVVRCRHIRGNIHEIGLKFDHAIDLSEFIDDAKARPGDQRSEVSESLPRFVGNVLYVSDNPDDRELMAFHLKRMGVRVVASSTSQCQEQYRAAKCSLIIMDAWTSNGSAAALASQVRAIGYAGPIVGLATEQGPPDEVTAAVLTQCFNKPITPDRLTEVLGQYLPHNTAGDASDPKPLLSAYWDDAMMRPLILTFLARLESRVRELDKLMLAENRLMLRRQCGELASTARGYGFPQIGQVSTELGDLAVSNAEAAPLRQKLDALAQDCRAACAIVRRAQSA